MLIKKVKNIFDNFNKKRLFLLLLLILILALLYLSFLPVISPDSTDYYNLSNIIKGILPLDQWWQLRGPTLPLIICIITFIFGDNPIGFLIGTFVFYMILVSCILLITRMVTRLFTNRFAKIFTYISVVLLVVFNPLIIGYYHAMLTEFVATTVAIICCFMAYKWIDVMFRSGTRIKYILYTIVFGVLVGLMWLLKQPYVTVAALPFLIASIVSMIKNSNIQNIICKFIALVICALLAFFISLSWSSYLCSKISCNTNSDTSSYFSKGLVNGLSSLREMDDSNELADILGNISPDSKYLDNKEKDLISDISSGLSLYKSYVIFDVLGGGDTTIDLMVATSHSTSGVLSTDESIAFLTEVLVQHPYVSVSSYVKNYLAAIDVISFAVDGRAYYPVVTNYFMNGGENLSLSYAAFVERPIYWWSVGKRPESANLLVNYEVMNKPNKVAYFLYQISRDPGLLLFMLTFLMVPVLFIYCLVRLIRNNIKKSFKIDRLNELLVILLGFSFLNAVLHILTGAIIDRYIFVGYPAALLAIILFVCSFIKIKKTIEPIKKSNSNKLLFVIPAYNEALNIRPVIKDIKKNVPEADILVINDCSKDNTREFVEDMGIKCITMPFNVRYAMAVQTGIRYARDNNYGYVIQFDADGQHLAKEAKQLFIEMKKTNSDIVIGSRFIKKTSYKHSLPRMIGTKMFSGIIHLFSGQKITDPTSGLQCLNGRVIEKYSKMGEYPEYPDANLIIDMLFRGYKISEVGVKMKQRENGESMHSGILKPIKYMIKITYAIFIIIINSIEFRKGKD